MLFYPAMCFGQQSEQISFSCCLVVVYMQTCPVFLRSSAVGLSKCFCRKKILARKSWLPFEPQQDVFPQSIQYCCLSKVLLALCLSTSISNPLAVFLYNLNFTHFLERNQNGFQNIFIAFISWGKYQPRYGLGNVCSVNA